MDALSHVNTHFYMDSMVYTQIVLLSFHLFFSLNIKAIVFIEEKLKNVNRGKEENEITQPFTMRENQS